MAVLLNLCLKHISFSGLASGVRWVVERTSLGGQDFGDSMAPTASHPAIIVPYLINTIFFV
jgi:hypothetical protein